MPVVVFMWAQKRGVTESLLAFLRQNFHLFFLLASESYLARMTNTYLSNGPLDSFHKSRVFPMWFLSHLCESAPVTPANQSKASSRMSRYPLYNDSFWNLPQMAIAPSISLPRAHTFALVSPHTPSPSSSLRK